MFLHLDEDLGLRSEPAEAYEDSSYELKAPSMEG